LHAIAQLCEVLVKDRSEAIDDFKQLVISFEIRVHQAVLLLLNVLQVTLIRAGCVSTSNADRWLLAFSPWLAARALQLWDVEKGLVAEIEEAIDLIDGLELRHAPLYVATEVEMRVGTDVAMLFDAGFAELVCE